MFRSYTTARCGFIDDSLLPLPPVIPVALSNVSCGGTYYGDDAVMSPTLLGTRVTKILWQRLRTLEDVRRRDGK
jgi:hypothetical protein